MSKVKGNTTIINRVPYLGLFCFLTLLGCTTSQQQQQAAMPDTHASDEAAIRKADANWAMAAQSKNLDAWVAFYADDAVVLPPNEKTSTGKDNIRKSIGEFLAVPGFSLNWKTAKVDVARSGDIAYTYGNYDLTINDSKGKSTKDSGKYLEIWKKQSDGGWKCVVDTWNSDLPSVPPSK